MVVKVHSPGLRNRDRLQGPQGFQAPQGRRVEAPGTGPQLFDFEDVDSERHVSNLVNVGVVRVEI